MHGKENLKTIQSEWHGTYKAYFIGFIISLLLTLTSFFFVTYKQLHGHSLVYTLLVLAITQAIIQLHFFLHLGSEPKPKWESLIFYFMILVLLVVALGSLWIMFDLNERMMPDMNMTNMEGMLHDIKGMKHD